MGSNHHAVEVERTTQEVTRDLVQRCLHTGSRFWLVVLILGGLLVLGVIGFMIRLSQGFDDKAAWGYQAAIFAYLLTTSQSAPLASIALRITKAHWRKPLARAAELWAVVGVLNLLLFIPLLYALPSSRGRLSIWFEWPGAPQAYDLAALVGLVVCGLALLWVSSIPDLAAVRDEATGLRRRILDRLVWKRWRGTPSQWRVLSGGIALVGTFYFILLIGVHTLVSADFAEAQVPGWKDAIFPAWHALSGLQSAMATTLVTLLVLRWTGYKEYITVDQFWGMSKLLLAVSLLWAYFWWASFITYWYGRTPAEQNVLKYLTFVSYRWPSLIALSLNWVVPFLALIWNPVRRSVLGPALVSCAVLVGTFFHLMRFYVGGFGVEDITARALEHVPPAHYPDALDLLIIVGALSGAVLFYLLATKLVPVVSPWEIREGKLYRVTQPLLRERFIVIAKPE